jgi:hypothetical protein
VLDELTRGAAAIGQAHGVAKGVQEAALQDLFAAGRVFDQVLVGGCHGGQTKESDDGNAQHDLCHAGKPGAA